MVEETEHGFRIELPPPRGPVQVVCHQLSRLTVFPLVLGTLAGLGVVLLGEVPSTLELPVFGAVVVALALATSASARGLSRLAAAPTLLEVGLGRVRLSGHLEAQLPQQARLRIENVGLGTYRLVFEDGPDRLAIETHLAISTLQRLAARYEEERLAHGEPDAAPEALRRLASTERRDTS